jgi:stage V sporulation protein SpoVS
MVPDMLGVRLGALFRFGAMLADKSKAVIKAVGMHAVNRAVDPHVATADM